MLAGGITGGMWRSTNGGATWARTTSTADLPSVSCIAQDTRPGKTRTWYFGSGEYRTNVQRWGNALYYGNGIFKSTDNGITWSHLPGTTGATNDQPMQPFNYVWNIVIDPSNTSRDVLYAAVYGGIMRSPDGGNSWQMVLGSAGNQSGFTNVAISSKGVLYATLSSDGATHGIFRSADGFNWSNITPTGFPSSTRGFALDIAPTDERVVYILAETPGKGLQVPSSYTDYEYYSFWKYTYVSGTGAGTGGAWADRSANLPFYGAGHGFNFNGLASYALVVRVEPDDANIVYLGGTNIYCSTDGFATPAAMSTWRGGYGDNYGYGDTAIIHPDQHTLVFSRTNPGRIYVGCDGGVWRLDDPTTPVPQWVSLNEGYITGQFYTVAMDHGTVGSTTVMGGLQDNGTVATDTISVAKPWQTLLGGDGSFCTISDSERVYVVSSQYASTYGYVKDSTVGYQFVQVQPDAWTGGGMALFVNPFMLDPANSNILYAQFGGTVWRNPRLFSSSPKDNWSLIVNSATPDHALISAMGVSKANPAHRMYIGTTNGVVYREERVDISDQPKVTVTGANFPTNAYINCIAVDPANGENALVVFSNYNVQSLFYTTNGGTSWTPVGGNLEQNSDGTGNGPSCRWATFLQRGKETICFVGTSIGLFSTTRLNGTNTVWTQEGSSTIGNMLISMVDARQSDGFVAVATWGNGMFSATIPIDNSAVAGDATAPRTTMLGENYPNPAVSRTTLPVTLARSGHVSLSVVTANGREVGRTDERDLSAGTHALDVDTRDLPSGVYWCRLSAGGVVELKKMMVRR